MKKSWFESWSDHDYRNNEKIDMRTTTREFLEDIEYDSKEKRLHYVIIKETKKPKIARYITRNYNRVPIYEGYSYRTRKIKEFDKNINPFLFVNEQLNKENISKNIMIKIINEIKIIPKWLEKEIKIETLNDEVYLNTLELRSYVSEKQHYNLNKQWFKDKSVGFWWRLLFAIPTIFLSFLGYCTKKQAKLNKQNNQDIKKKNEAHKIKIDKKNLILKTNINKWNINLEAKIKKIEIKIEKETNLEIDLNLYEDEDWINLRRAINIDNKHLRNQKGVYIIYNKTKSKFYVGQSKNLFTRIFTQHFSKGDVKNIVFAKDWYNNDDFCYKYIICVTKDELDQLEKKYIQEYNSFENGYNKTGGNI